MVASCLKNYVIAFVGVYVARRIVSSRCIEVLGLSTQACIATILTITKFFAFRIRLTFDGSRMLEANIYERLDTAMPRSLSDVSGWTRAAGRNGPRSRSEV